MSSPACVLLHLRAYLFEGARRCGLHVHQLDERAWEDERSPYLPYR